jgi:tryptophan synthase alpha chain
MTRIAYRFDALRRADRKAFIPYITAGDPDLETTARLILELEKSGADVIELGVPFSDPMADGPVIQRASERALRNHVTVRDCLGLVKRLRPQSGIPIVLFSYYNPLLALGEAGSGRALRDAGVDGVLVTDLVPEEAGDFIREMRASDVDTIFLVAPTSTDTRIERVAEACRGFVYAVSRTGITGVRESLSEAAGRLVERIRRFTNLPIAVGFGVSTHEHVLEVWRHADAAVVGSRIVAEIAEHAGTDSLVEKVGRLTRELLAGADAGE